MSNHIALIMPAHLSDTLAKIKHQFDVAYPRDFTDSLEHALNENEHVYFWSGCGSRDGFGSHNICKSVEAGLHTIEEHRKEWYLESIYPSIEKRKKHAVKYVDIIHAFFKECGFNRMGIVKFWWSGDGMFNISNFPATTVKLDDINMETVMKFEYEVIYYIEK